MGVYSQRCDFGSISRYANRASPQKRSISELRNHRRDPSHHGHNNTGSRCANSRQRLNAVSESESESDTAADIITKTNASRSTSSRYAPNHNAANHNTSPSDAADHRAAATPS